MNEIEPPAETTQDLSDDSRVEQLRRALKVGNRGEICRQIEAAGEHGSARAVPYLAAVLRDRDRWRDRLARNRPYRRRLKLAAIEALRKIGDTFAAESLPVALFDRDEVVCRHAARALVTFGPRAVPPLLHTLERQPEWTVPQMRLLIETLGEIGDPRSGPSLSRIMLGLNPYSSGRWFRRTFLFPGIFTISLISTIGILASIAMFCEIGNPMTLETLLAMIASSLLFGIFGGLLLFLPLYFTVLLPVGISWSNTELAALASSAADVLIQLDDKRALPSVIEATYAGRRKAQPAARRALCHLLPLLDANDSELLPRASLQFLLDSISPLRQAVAPQSSELTAAIVLALRYVGPGSAAETVQKLQQRSDIPALLDACRETLPVLLARRAQERAASTLLRASAQPATPDAQLLRPSAAAPNTPPEQLLRPME